MPIVLILAAAAILGGVVVVAMGQGGELAYFGRDLPEMPMQLRTPSDVARLRLPTGLFGYQAQATSQALRTIAGLLSQQEAEITQLRDEVWRLRSDVDDALPANDEIPGRTASSPAATAASSSSPGMVGRSGHQESPPQ